MRSDEWILVEDAYAETLSVSSIPESIPDMGSAFTLVADPLSLQLVPLKRTDAGCELFRACNLDEPENTVELNLVEDERFPKIESMRASFVLADIRNSLRKFTTLNIVSPRIDPELGRLAAPKLRTGNLVGSIYKPDLESVLLSKRWKERASLLLRAN